MRKAGGERRGVRYSLRRLLYSSPLLPRRLRPSPCPPVHHHHPPPPTTPAPGEGVDKLSRSSVDRNASPSDGHNAETKVDMEVDGLVECSLCLQELSPEYFPKLSTCQHRSCYDCFHVYLRIEILESRVNIACPQCPEIMHPNDIRMIVNDKELYDKYEDFMVRRVLAVEPDTRWCPAPDCSYAVIASGCAGCPKIKCLRPGCGSYFCYHCKAAWHPNQTCDAARAQRSPPNLRSSSLSFSQDSQHRDDMKPCPRCEILIVKMDDGSCNHMTCSVCAAEFCWLCMKEISDLHYLSPSGCTFWGKKPWSRKKKILWQLGTLVGAPVGIGLVAGIAVPAIIIGIPVWVGRKLYNKYGGANKHKRNLIVAGGVRLDFHSPTPPAHLPPPSAPAHKIFEGDAGSQKMSGSIGEAGSLGSGSQVEREMDKESAVALAGSITSAAPPPQRMEVQADVVSRRLSNGSVLSDMDLYDDTPRPVRRPVTARLILGSSIGEDDISCGGVSSGAASCSTPPPYFAQLQQKAENGEWSEADAKKFATVVSYIDDERQPTTSLTLLHPDSDRSSSDEEGVPVTLDGVQVRIIPS